MSVNSSQDGQGRVARGCAAIGCVVLLVVGLLLLTILANNPCLHSDCNPPTPNRTVSAEQGLTASAAMSLADAATVQEFSPPRPV